MNHFLNRAIFRGLRAAFLVLLLPASLLAQMGNDNPTGVSGMYNGNVTTAGSYDPYTGNATRSVTDISVAGAVGAYPLAFTRTMNSRYNPSAGLEFGPSGSWRHSYQWSIEPHVYTTTGFNRWTYLPNVYTVNYPDGRRLSFSQASNDTRFRAGSGISDRFQQLTNVDGGMVYVLLPDGGKIAFEATVIRNELSEVTHLTESYFTYELVGIIDPYGQTTTITSGTNTMTVQEPGGRTLTAYYISTPWNGDVVIDRVVSSDGRSVKYNYGGYQPAGATTYTYLGNVQYLEPNGTSYAQAIYAYQPGNDDPDGRPLLHWAIDPMYAGPMWAISYSFVPGESGVHGQLQSEKYLDPFTGTPGQVVSSLSANGNSRTETRGDGPSRTFNYYGSKIVSYTDFKGKLSSISYDGNGFKWTFTDARGKTTTTLREGLLGAISVLTHPDTEHSTRGYTYWTANGAPYYSQIYGDERGHNTYFTRDPNNFRLTRIDYPDYPNGPSEEFTYNSFGQVETHRLTTGGTETLTYDARHRLETRTPPATPSDANPAAHPTRYSYYESGRDLDRLRCVIDPRGNSTCYDYNWRGQVTRVTHHDTSFAQMGYNIDGTLAWTADENHPGADTNPNQRTRYTYDNYKRVVSVTDPVNNTTTASYAPWNGAGQYSHTSNAVYHVTGPAPRNVPTDYDYDQNFRRTIFRAAAGTSDDAWTVYGYDDAGNLTSIQDPKNNVTTFGYDNRNRKVSATNPYPFNNQVTQWEYDTTNNLTKEIRPDGYYRELTYDSLNRPTDSYGFDYANTAEHIHFDRNATGTQESMTDSKGKVYATVFDVLRRRISMSYPVDANNEQRGESWEYDEAGNLHKYTNRDGAIQTFAPYDNRNRPQSFSWSGGSHPTQGASFTYYDNGNLQTAINDEADLAFGYDDANHLLSETQTVKTYGLYQIHPVSYQYEEGNRSRLLYPQGYDYRYTYTNRNQIGNIRLAWLSNPTIQYSYDKNGNRLTRTTYGGAHTDYDFNELNGLRSQTSYFAAGRTARFDYGFDVLNRIKYERKDGGLADGFGYDVRNQLTGFNQNGTLNQDGSVTASYNVSISYDANGNRINAFDGNNAQYTTADSNQYTSDWTGGLTYDRNANLTSRAGWTYTYDAQNRLTTINNNGGTVIHQHYDALGRIVARDVNQDPNQITINVWDGWNLLEERDRNDGFKRMYFHGAATNEIVASTGPAYGDAFYFQDGRGNTTHLTDGATNLIEQYRYFVSGQPSFFDGNGNWLPNSSKDIRHLFGGALYLPEAGAGLYDMRNRFYLPNLGRFMQSDPLGFGAGDGNLFRYCGSDPVNARDPLGLWTGQIGLSVSGQFGVVVGMFSAGIAFDGHGNIGFYYSPFGGGGAGMNGSGGIAIAGSNADTIFGLQKDFTEVGANGGEVIDGSVNVFTGKDVTNGRQVTGIGITIGAGAGLGGYGGTSWTTIRPIFTPSLDKNGNPFPPPGTDRITGEYPDGTVVDMGPQINVVSTPISPPSLGSFHVNPGTFFLPGFGSGLNPGSLGGASAAAVQQALWDTLFGIPGGGPQPGEGTHPVSWELR